MAGLVFPRHNARGRCNIFSAVVNSLHGWVDSHTVLATDMQDAYWLSEDNQQQQQQSVALKDIYGAAFQIMSSDTIRVNPVNSDLLLIRPLICRCPPVSSWFRGLWPRVFSFTKGVRNAA